MSQDIDTLLNESLEKMNTSQLKQDYDDTFKGLADSLYEWTNIKIMSDQFTTIRDNLISKLYDTHSVSAIKLAEATGLSRQMIHNIVKENNNEV